MTTTRLSGSQKRKVREASRFLTLQRGRRVTQGEAIEDALDFALQNRVLWLQRSGKELVPLREDPLFDRRLTFSMGKTDSAKLDELTYGGD